MPRARRGASEATAAGSSASAVEIARFAAQASAWWDADGAFRPLHRINPVRLRFARDHIVRHFGRDAERPRPLRGLDVIDIGCGGGLLCEPMRRLGATVTGIDGADENILVAQAHARDVGLDIAYEVAVPETLAAEGRAYDVVLNMEVVEHVADVDAFLAATAALLKPGGAMVLSTINRTLRSLALAKVAAEYVLRWVPAGTHDWRRFVRPSELARGLRGGGVEIVELAGLVYRPLSGEWRIGRDVAVNYLAFALKD